MESQDDTYLYHYTTVDAFINIIKNQKLWASNILYLNDSAEFHLAITLARRLLKDMIDDEANTVRPERLAAMDKLLDEPIPGAIATPLCYVCCFSEEKDDLNPRECDPFMSSHVSQKLYRTAK